MSTLTTVQGVNNTKKNATPPQMKEANMDYGKVRVLYDEYVLATGDNFGTSGLIRLFTIKKGMRLLNAFIRSADLGTTGVADVGYAASDDGVETADPDGIFAAVDLKTAAVGKWMDATTLGAAYMKKFSADVEVQIDFSEATDGSGSRTISLMALVSVE